MASNDKTPNCLEDRRSAEEQDKDDPGSQVSYQLEYSNSRIYIYMLKIPFRPIPTI